jgi:outer membrane protein assembly factor BamB
MTRAQGTFGRPDPDHSATLGLQGRAGAPGARAVVALDARSGATIWATRLAARHEPGSVILADGRVFTVTSDPRSTGRYDFSVEAFSADSGRRLCPSSVRSASYVHLGATPAATASLVVFPSPDGNIYALDTRTGALRWQHHFGHSSSVPTLVNGVVWLASDPLRGDSAAALVALKMSNGKELWRTPLHESVESAADPSAVGAEGTVIFSTTRRILALGAVH